MPAVYLPNRIRNRFRAALTPARYGGQPFLPTAAKALLAPRRRVFVRTVPLPSAIFTKIAAINGYQLSINPERPHDIGLNSRAGNPLSSPTGFPTLNGQLLSNAKSNVAATFEAVFGYSLAVDPTTHVGQMVEKSEVNAVHDGRLIQGPIALDDVQPESAYQRFIDTRDESGMVVDLRTPLYGGSVPLVYTKRRQVEDLFWTRTADTEILESAEVYSEKELALLSRFAEAMGLDYGEVDVLRDRREGRIYVVDVNQGPAGPPKKLAPPEASVAVSKLSAAFDRLVQDTIDGFARARPHIGSPTHN